MRSRNESSMIAALQQQLQQQQAMFVQMQKQNVVNRVILGMVHTHLPLASPWPEKIQQLLSGLETLEVSYIG